MEREVEVRLRLRLKFFFVFGRWRERREAVKLQRLLEVEVVEAKDAMQRIEKKCKRKSKSRSKWN